MVDEFRLPRQFRQFAARGNFGPDHPQPRMRFDRAQIRQAARGKVVNDHDVFAVVKQRSTRCEPMNPAPPVTRWFHLLNL